MQKIKILHVGEYVQGGVATYIKTLVAHENSNIENYILCSDYKSEHNWSLSECQVKYYEYKRSVANIPKAIYFIYKVINCVAPDIVYCHSTWAGFFVRVPLLFARKRFKVVYNAHGWSFLQTVSKWKCCIYAWVEKTLSVKTDHIINVSKNEYEEAIRWGIDESLMSIIYSGISEEKEKNSIQINWPDDKINILFVGRFDQQKGIDILLEEFNKCSRADLQLTVIGEGVLKENNYKVKYGYDNVKFLGWVSHEEISAYYKAADVVVMPSRWEAFGLVAIEAMKYGTPVIASNCGALKEIIQHNKNGYLFSLKKGELTSILQKLSKKELIQLGKNAKLTFLQRYRAEQMINKTEELYMEINFSKK